MWYIIILLLTIIYILINMVLTVGFVEAYIIRPILWILLSILVFRFADQEGINIWKFKKIRKWEIGRSPIEAGMLIGGFQVSLLFLAGLFFGMGKSPYFSLHPLSILTNILYVSSILICIELCRSYFIKKSISKKNFNVIIISVTILFIIISIPLNALSVLSFNEPTASFEFIGVTIIPLFVMGIFASYLAYLGGSTASIGYFGVIQFFEWFSPVLPDIDWPMKALIGTLAPSIGFLIIQNSINIKHKHKKKKKKSSLSWPGVAVISLVIIFFSFGYFGVQPTVVISGSMKPSIDVGDVVIVSEIYIDEIKQGDIIQFRFENIDIIHRVTEIYNNDNIISFSTKGDANNKIDPDLVFSEQIKGKVIFTIPKLGWISIGIKSIINI